MPTDLTAVTEIATALGTLADDLPSALARRPHALANVDDATWARLVEAHRCGEHLDAFERAFEAGRAFLAADDALRGRRPRLVEWKGPHRPPGDDVVPADLRLDHVYLVSCKYLSKVLLNPGPPRLFDRLLVGDERSGTHWFAETAPRELDALYTAAAERSGLAGLPPTLADTTRDQQKALKATLSSRQWPDELVGRWDDLCATVAAESARRWSTALASPRDRLRLLWKLLRISGATYFVLGTSRTDQLRLRVDSNWDWLQAHELTAFEVAPRRAGQPEVGWRAQVRHRDDGRRTTVEGHVEVRWSHGRFVGSPEAKVYLDTPHSEVPGYHRLR